MAERPLLLDLFCGAGGCSAGYVRAGFNVVGVDNRPQPRYPFFFIQADALEYLAKHGWEYDAIHASPPCQAFAHASFTLANRSKHQDLVGVTRELLFAVGKPWVIENVVPAPLSPWSITLCGLMFGLKVFRHRRFESSHMMLAPAHPSHSGKVIGKNGMCCVVGHGGGVGRKARERISRHGAGGQQNKPQWQAAMGIDWMTRNELSQAIPPAYTEFIGRQLLTKIRS